MPAPRAPRAPQSPGSSDVAISLFGSPRASHAARPLKRDDRARLLALLERDVPSNLFSLAWLEQYGVRPRGRADAFSFYGVDGPNGALDGAALVIAGRLLLADARRPEVSAALGASLADLERSVAHVVSARSIVDPLWAAYRDAPPRRPARLISPQSLYALDRRARAARAPEPDDDSVLRPARPADLEAVFLASARMHHEETGEDPLRDHPGAFREHVRHRIDRGRCFVRFDDHRRLIFKVDLSATSTRYGVQISGVYTEPASRGRGWATRAITALIAELFARGYPRVTLYVNSENAAARRVYERVGFTYYDEYATVFVAN